jgi:hypothetical protein
MSTYEDEDWAVQAGQIAGRGRIPTARAEKKQDGETSVLYSSAGSICTNRGACPIKVKANP